MFALKISTGLLMRLRVITVYLPITNFTGKLPVKTHVAWQFKAAYLKLSTMLRVAALCFSVAAAHKHAGYGPLNPLLGTHGYPSCVAGPQGMCVEMTDQCLEKNQMTMACHQNKGLEGALRIGAIGDSITAGACSSGGDHPYPQQLQLMLNASQYTVTNLGACGSTMQKGADSPYWKRPQFTTLTQNKWDVIIIMLGTNDAKDSIDGGPSNWVCGTDLTNITVENCRFAQDCKCFLFFVFARAPVLLHFCLCAFCLLSPFRAPATQHLAVCFPFRAPATPLLAVQRRPRHDRAGAHSGHHCGRATHNLRGHASSPNAAWEHWGKPNGYKHRVPSSHPHDCAGRKPHHCAHLRFCWDGRRPQLGSPLLRLPLLLHLELQLARVRVVVRCSALRPVPVSLFPRSTHHTHTHTSSQSCAEKYPASVSPVSPTPLPALLLQPQ